MTENMKIIQKVEKHLKDIATLSLSITMVNIKMIDSQGYGIHTMFSRQKDRYLPMPDYTMGIEDGVLLTIPGNVIDIEYSIRLIKTQALT